MTWKEDKSPRRFAEMAANVQIEISTLQHVIPTATGQVFTPSMNKHLAWRKGVVDNDRANHPNEREDAIRGGNAYAKNYGKVANPDGVAVREDLDTAVRMVKEIEGLPAVAAPPPPLAAYIGLFPDLWLEFHTNFWKTVEHYRTNPSPLPPQSTGNHTFAELLSNAKIDSSGAISHPFWVPAPDHNRDRHKAFLYFLGTAPSKGEIETALIKGDNWSGGMQGTAGNNGMDPEKLQLVSAAADVVLKLSKTYGIWDLLDGHFRAATAFKPKDEPEEKSESRKKG